MAPLFRWQTCARRWRSTSALLLAGLGRDDRGQDLIEYALLTAAIGVAGIAVWPSIEDNIGRAYLAMNRRALSLSAPPNPGAGR